MNEIPSKMVERRISAGYESARSAGIIITLPAHYNFPVLPNAFDAVLITALPATGESITSLPFPVQRGDITIIIAERLSYYVSRQSRLATIPFRRGPEPKRDRHDMQTVDVVSPSLPKDGTDRHPLRAAAAVIEIHHGFVHR